MKKKVMVLLCLLLMFLTITACAPTVYTEREQYGVGEEILIRDNESNAVLGRVTVTEVRVLKGETVLPELYDIDDNGNPRYRDKKYEALVRMTYEAKTVDNRMTISEDNFRIYDFNGTKVYRDPDLAIHESYTASENQIIFAVEKTGGVNIDLYFYADQEPIATVSAPCGELSEATQKELERNEALKRSCLILLAIDLPLLVTTVILLARKKRARAEDRPRAVSLPVPEPEEPTTKEEGETL